MTTAPTPLHQECTDFATSLRSAFNVVITTRGSARKSLLRAAVLLESAAAALRRLQAENECLRAGLEPRKPLTEAEANALWATCLQKHKRPGPFELIQEFCAAGQSGATTAEARNPLIASREVVSDGPVRVTRLHLSTEGRAALTTKATGPLPGTKET